MSGYKEILKQTNNIIINLNKINVNIHKLKNKIIQLNKINSSLENNKLYKSVEMNSVFQLDILKNELRYYNNIYFIFLDKYMTELNAISEYILIILVSLKKLELENKNSIERLFNKIIFTKNTSNTNSDKLKELINSIINNLKVVDDFINLIEYYLEELSFNNKKNNIHNDDLELNLKHKRNALLLEHKKHFDNFLSSIYYFKDSSDTVINQIETSELLNFFLNLKSKDKLV